MSNVRPYNIQIEPVLNGFVAQVGCQRIVVKTPAELGAAIAEYYSNPEKVHHRFIKDRVNNTIGGAPEGASQPPGCAIGADHPVGQYAAPERAYPHAVRAEPGPCTTEVSRG